MKHSYSSMHTPINGEPNIQDDDPVNRGISGQCLFEKDQYYDPATGRRMEYMGGMGKDYLSTNLIDSVPVPSGPDAGYPMAQDMTIPEDQPNAMDAGAGTNYQGGVAVPSYD